MPGEPMVASTLDRFVAGLLVCATLVMPSEWLPEIWAADAASDSAPVFETEQQANDVTRLIMADYNAMALRPSSWASIAAADRCTRGALAGPQALIEIADGTSARAKPEIDELIKKRCGAS